MKRLYFNMAILAVTMLFSYNSYTGVRPQGNVFHEAARNGDLTRINSLINMFRDKPNDITKYLIEKDGNNQVPSDIVIVKLFDLIESLKKNATNKVKAESVGKEYDKHVNILKSLIDIATDRKINTPESFDNINRVIEQIAGANETIVAKSSDIKKRIKGGTRLHKAIKEGNLEEVAALIKEYEDKPAKIFKYLRVQDENGQIPTDVIIFKMKSLGMDLQKNASNKAYLQDKAKEFDRLINIFRQIINGARKHEANMTPLESRHSEQFDSIIQRLSDKKDRILKEASAK